MDDEGSSPIQGVMPTRGMALRKKAPSPMMDILGPDAGMPSNEPAKAEEAQQAPAAPVVNPLLDPVSVNIEEKFTANLHLEGGLVGEAECLGQFVVTVLDTAKADLVCFKLAEQDARFKYKVHPNLNKASQANGVLEVRDASKAFRANTPAPLVKWRYTSNKEDILPISISCWPSSTADGTAVVLEYELTDTSMQLQDCHVRFPCPSNAKAQITNVDNGEAQYEPANQQLHCYIPVITHDQPSGTLEFTAATDISVLTPFTFEATLQGRTLCPMNITECYHQGRGDAISYSGQVSSTYSFTVGG